MNPEPCYSKTKKRSINTEPVILPTYNADARVGPPQMQGIGDTRVEIQLAK
jgi:hypothetical protein